MIGVTRKPVVAVVVAVAVSSLTGCRPPSPWNVERVSVDLTGDRAGGNVRDVVVSRDGRKVAFNSAADDITSTPDANGAYDVFVRDVVTGETELVSVAAGGDATAAGHSGSPEFSPDGTAILFASEASDIAPGDDDDTPDWFLRDLVSGTTRLVSGNGEARWEPEQAQFSPDGSMIAFTAEGVHLYDVATGATTPVSVAGDGSPRPGQTPVFSPDGTKVAFVSAASDLVAQPTSGQADVYMRDLAAGTTTLVSGRDAGGNDASFAPTFSDDGRRVGFLSLATDLTPVEDNNSLQDVFVRDLATGDIELASVNTAGTATGERASGIFDPPEFLPDGRVVFMSDADDLVPNDANLFWDVFARDVDADETELVSVNAAGTASGNGHSQWGRPLPDGRVVFTSSARDLVSGGTLGNQDIYVRDMEAGTTTLVTERWDGTASANGHSVVRVAPQDAVSADGRALAFVSSAGDLTPDEVPGIEDNDAFLARFETADLRVAASATPDPVPEGAEVTYEVRVVNAGPSSPEEATVVVVLPADTAFVAADATPGTCTPPASGGSSQVVTCSVSDVPVGDVTSVTVRASVTAPAGTTLRAVAGARSLLLDPAPGDTVAIVDTPVVP